MFRGDIRPAYQSRRQGGLLSFAPPNRAPTPKLKYGTVEISGILLNFQCQAHMRKRKGFEDFLATTNVFAAT